MSGSNRGKAPVPRGALRGALIILFVALALSGCAKKGGPQPPPDEPNTYPRTYPSV